jgi:hypothetical protein
MSETDSEAEATDDGQDSLTFEAIMEFATDQVESENDEFPGEFPKHAGTLLSTRANELLTTLTGIQVARAHEEADDPDDEEIQTAVAEDAVDILLALGALKFEYDLNIAEAFEERRDQILAFQNADSMEEMMETMMEAEGVNPEDIEMPAQPGMGGVEPEPGDDVSDDDFDGDPDKHIQ